MVAYAYNLSTWKASAGESQIESQPRLQSKNLSQKARGGGRGGEEKSKGWFN